MKLLSSSTGQVVGNVFPRHPSERSVPDDLSGIRVRQEGSAWIVERIRAVDKVIVGEWESSHATEAQADQRGRELLGGGASGHWRSGSGKKSEDELVNMVYEVVSKGRL